MNCPHCGKEIIVSLTAPAEDILHRWEELAGPLLAEWYESKRAARTDDQNLTWLDGRQSLLREIGISKQMALRFLKQGLPTGE